VKSRLASIVQKEFIHILRDPRTLLIVFVWPILMILIYGYAITFDIKDIRLGVLDQDRTPMSRQFIQKLTGSDYFKISEILPNREGIEDAFLERRFRAAVIIPKGFMKSLASSPSSTVQLVVDGSNANSATVAINYLKSFVVTQSLEANGIRQAFVSLEPRVWYNPDLKSAPFIVPGLMAVIMMMICALLTAVTIAREWETGTMEQILVSPIRAVEVVFGKVAPYIVLALVDSILVVGVSVLVFGVPFRGSPILLFLFSILYVYAALGIGVLISSFARTQQIALMAAMLATMLPSFLLSGFIFPIRSMPVWLQAVTAIVPARYYLVIIRGIMLKGVGAGPLLMPAAFLVVFGTVLLLLSVRRFRSTLEG
jgi:ABC-2 type transport system permease protein